MIGPEGIRWLIIAIVGGAFIIRAVKGRSWSYCFKLKKNGSKCKKQCSYCRRDEKYYKQKGIMY